MKIVGGYYIKARVIQQSAVATSPPHVREIWDWLLKEANHKDKKYNGYIVKRGQLFRTYRDIREGLSWKIGWRKMMYSENHTKKAMKTLREYLMIDTKKALGGVLITILNYDFYQDPKNYESTNESTIMEPLRNQTLPYNNKNEKNEKKEKKMHYVFLEFFNYWKTLEILPNEEFADETENALERAFENYSETELLESIDNYSFVLNSPDHYFANRYSLVNFLKFSVERFLTKEDPDFYYSYFKARGGEKDLFKTTRKKSL